MRLRPSLRPTEVVVLPSPAGVGLIAVTRISLPSGLSAWVTIQSIAILALVRPYGSSASSGMPSLAAISPIGFILAWRAISISVGMGILFRCGFREREVFAITKFSCG